MSTQFLFFLKSPTPHNNYKNFKYKINTYIPHTKFWKINLSNSKIFFFFFSISTLQWYWRTIQLKVYFFVVRSSIGQRFNNTKSHNHEDDIYRQALWVEQAKTFLISKLNKKDKREGGIKMTLQPLLQFDKEPKFKTDETK